MYTGELKCETILTWKKFRVARETGEGRDVGTGCEDMKNKLNWAVRMKCNFILYSTNVKFHKKKHV